MPASFRSSFGFVPALRLVVLCGASALVWACDRAPPADEKDGPTVQASNTAGTPALPAPVTPAPLGRVQMLAAFARAADATAAGQPLPDANRELTGRAFSLALPIGCDRRGETDAADAAHRSDWSVDETSRTLRITVHPQRWGETEWVRALAGGMTYEAAEGFWIPRPWTSSEGCPASDPQPADSAPAAHQPRDTVGIVQFFPPGSPRTFRRGSRPYAHTQRLDKDSTGTERGYRMVASGRISAYPDGQPIHCRIEAADLPPVCLMAMELNRIAFEDNADGALLAEWHH